MISSSGTGCLVRYNTWGPSFESTRDTSFLCFWLHPADVSHGMYYPLPQCVGALNIPFRSPLAGSAFLRLLSELLRLRDITTGSGTSPRHSCSSQLIFYFNFPVFEGEWLHQWIYFYSLFKILNQLILTLTLSLWSNSKSTFLSNFYFLSLSRTNRFKVKSLWPRSRDRAMAGVHGYSPESQLRLITSPWSLHCAMGWVKEYFKDCFTPKYGSQMKF